MDSIDSVPKSYFMDKLWKKEPNGDLVEFLPDMPLTLKQSFDHYISQIRHRFLGNKFWPVKSDPVASHFRVWGNEQFKEGNYRAAMELYNRSLLFSVAGSENVSLAYSNRSTCFLRMKKYVECLNDIKTAKENGYPERLMHKLNEREATCLEKLKNGHDIQSDDEPKLSFDPNEHFPCLANVLGIQSNEEFGRHIVAKCDIDVGQTVLVEEPFACAFDGHDRAMCFTCLKVIKNFIPCQNCTEAMFCDEKCIESNQIHKMTCGNAGNRLSPNKILMDSIVSGLIAFPNVDDLMEFVEKQLSSPSLELPTNSLDAQAEYGIFLKSNVLPVDTDFQQVQRVFVTYQLLMDIPKFCEKFNTKQKQRFLQHLIWQHVVLGQNGILNPMHGDCGVIALVGNIQSLFNHSCAPNLHSFSHNRKTCCITIRPVKKGEQVFIMYVTDLLGKPTEYRKQYLLKEFKFKCKCARCVPTNVNKMDELNMMMDPNFKFIYLNRDNLDSNNSTIKKKCFKFMKKYGHLPSSDENSFVCMSLVFCLQRDYPEYIKSIF